MKRMTVMVIAMIMVMMLASRLAYSQDTTLPMAERPEFASYTKTSPKAPGYMVKLGYFEEKKGGCGDYGVTYSVFELPNNIRGEIDLFDTPRSYKRAWINTNYMKLIQNENFSLTLRPGILADNSGNIWYGGFFDANAPKLGASVHWKCYAGSAVDKNVMFNNLKLGSNLNLQHYYFFKKNYQPDSTIGPRVTGVIKVKGAKIEWSAFHSVYSFNYPGAQTMDLQLWSRF
jgi:hypothetical protein